MCLHNMGAHRRRRKIMKFLKAAKLEIGEFGEISQSESGTRTGAHVGVLAHSENAWVGLGCAALGESN